MLEINYEIIKISKILITESLLSRCSLLSLSLSFYPPDVVSIQCLARRSEKKKTSEDASTTDRTTLRHAHRDYLRRLSYPFGEIQR